VVAQAKYLRANFRLYRQFFFQFPLQRGWKSFSFFHLAAGKFPLKSIGVGAPPLANQNAVAPAYDAGDYQNGFLFSHQGIRL
jgi:hypothetical protein